MIIPTVRFNEYTKKFAFADLAKANLLKREVTPSYHRRSLVRIKKLELLSATPRATLTHLSCSPNFPRASYLDERTLTYEPIVNYQLS